MKNKDILSNYYKQTLYGLFLNLEDGGVRSTGVEFYDDLSELIGKHFTNEELMIIANRAGPPPSFYEHLLNA